MPSVSKEHMQSVSKEQGSDMIDMRVCQGSKQRKVGAQSMLSLIRFFGRTHHTDSFNRVTTHILT